MDSNPDSESKYRFLCLFVADGKVAAAYYEPEISRISVLPQMPEPGSGFEVSMQILRQVDPTFTIIPSSASKEFEAAVRCYTDQEEVTSRTPAAISEQIDSERLPDTPDQDADLTTVTISATLTTAGSSTTWPMTSPAGPATGSASGTEKQTPRKRAKRQQLLNRVTNNIVSVAAKFFSVENAKNEILNYDGFQIPPNASRAMKQSFLAGCIDFEETVTIRALAGLITFLTRTGVNQLVAITSRLTVTTFRLVDAVRVSDATLRSLAIVSSHLIPRPERVAVCRKPAPSVFGLFEAGCKTQAGKKELRQLLVQPIRVQKELNDRLDFVQYFIQPEREQLMAPDSLLRQRLFRVKSLNSVFRQMRCKLVLLSDWRTLVHSFNAAVLALDCMKSYGQPAVMVERAAALHTPQIMELSSQIEQVVELARPDAAYEPMNISFSVKEGFFPQLDARRQLLAQIDDLLKAATLREAEEWTSRGMSVPLFTISFTYGPGFLLQLALHTSDLSQVIGVLNERGADQVFNVRLAGRSHVYFKTQHLKQFDLDYGDPIQEIASMQTKIQYDMQVLVLEHADTITEMIDHCASVEALLAFADMAKQEGWCRPTFSEDVFQITNGKHPLYEKEVGPGNFQANGLTSPDQGRKVKIITGPNASGKTVFMKQVGIITHLALCGSYVPAESAVIPVVDSIFATLKHNYSITMESSTFFSDLKGMSTIVNHSTGKSLVLVDEFGKGTRPQDGIALLAATIKYLLKKETPHLLLASHFHCLSEILKEDERHMQYLRFAPDINSDGIFQPNYLIEEGKAGKSLASSVYAMVGLDKVVADRAKEIYECLMRRKQLDPNYNEEQKQTIARIKEIMRIFQKTNMGFKLTIEDMFDEIMRIPLI